MRASSLALLISLSGCLSSPSTDRVQTIYAAVEPSDATLWIDDGVERHTIGRGEVKTERVRETPRSSLDCGGWLAAALVSTLVSTLVYMSSREEPPLHHVSRGLAFSSAIGLAAMTALCTAYAVGEVDSPERAEIIGASRRGYGDEYRQIPPVHMGKHGVLYNSTVHYLFQLYQNRDSSSDQAGDRPSGLLVADLVDDSGLLSPELRTAAKDRIARSLMRADGSVRLVRDPARGASRTLVTHLFSMNGTCMLSAAEVDLESETVGRAASISVGCGAQTIQVADLDQLAVMLAHGEGAGEK